MTRHEEIIKKLNRLKTIGPDPGFTKTSKALIFSQKPSRFIFINLFKTPVFRLTASLVVILLIITTLSIEFAYPKPVLSSSFNSKDLAAEFENLAINIQIEEIKYREKANQTIVSALNEIENTRVNHLNNSLIQSEKENVFKLEESTNPEIDKLLNEVIF